MNSLITIDQMHLENSFASVAINEVQNAAILDAQIIVTGDSNLAERLKNFKNRLNEKIVKTNDELKIHKFEYMVI